MAACGLLGTPLGALCFNSASALVPRHPPLFRDEERYNGPRKMKNAPVAIRVKPIA